MKNERIDELDKICEEATDAPWTAEIYEYDVGVNGPFHKPICTTFDNRENKNSNKGDPIFIATARTALPEALVEIKELKKDLDKQLDQEGALLDYNIELRAEVERLKAEMKADNRRLVGEVERFRKEWQEAIEGNTRLSKQLDQALAQLEAAAKWLDEKSRAGRISDTEDRLELYKILNPKDRERCPTKRS
jgi:hypothetical protein